MAYGDTWTDADKAELERLWIAGHGDAEIAELMGRTKHSVATRRHVLALTESMAPPSNFRTVWFPQFEDITVQEARRVCAGFRSGRWSKAEPTSGSSSCSAMLVYV